MAAVGYDKRGVKYRNTNMPVVNGAIVSGSTPVTQDGYLDLVHAGVEYRIPYFSTVGDAPIASAQVLERTYTITTDNRALTSGAWVPIEMDAGAGDDLSSQVAHTAGTTDFVFQPGVYNVVIQYSFAALAGGSQQGSVQWYDVTLAGHDGYHVRTTGGPTIYGTMSVLVRNTVAETFHLRLNCVSSGSPTTGVGADFYIQIARLR